MSKDGIVQLKVIQSSVSVVIEIFLIKINCHSVMLTIYFIGSYKLDDFRVRASARREVNCPPPVGAGTCGASAG